MRKAVRTAVLVSLLCGPICAQQTFYGVKATVADQAGWGAGAPFPGRPIRWTGSASWFSGDQGFHSEACVLALYPVGSQVLNGYYEFPGAIATSGTLGNACMSLQPGACIVFDVQQDAPDYYGQTLVILTQHPCITTLTGIRIVSYSPNSGAADGCIGAGSPCQNIHLVADPPIRSQFDSAIPSVLGHSILLTGYYQAPGSTNFIVTVTPHT